MSESLQLILTALGHAIISSVWQAGLIWLLVVGFFRLFPSVAPSKLSAISFASLITSFIAFICTFIFSLLSPNTDGGFLQWIISVQLLKQSIIVVATTYILLLLVPAIKFFIGIAGIYKLKTKSLGKVPGHLKIFLLDAVQYLGIKRKIQIFSSGIINSPLTVGYLKPVILFPVALINQLSLHQAEAIILHELAHIKRNDYLQNMITQIIVTLLYFNPFVKKLSNIQNLEREKSADNWVMQFEYNNSIYANTLLQLAKQSVQEKNYLAIPISGKSNTLLQRVEYLLGVGKRRYPSLKNIAGMFVIILFLLGISLIKKTYPLGLQDKGFVTVNHKPGNSLALNKNIVQTDNTENILSSKPVKTIKNDIVTNPNVTIKVAAKSAAKTDVEPMAISPEYINNFATIIPSLPAEKEQNIEQALVASKTIIAEQNWKAINQSLAETVTDETKDALKEAYKQKIQAIDLSRLANQLRLQYNDINWENANENISIALGTIKLDSIYNNYTQAVTELTIFKKQMETLSPDFIDRSAINNLLRKYKTALRKIDTLRSKKIVEL